MRELRHKKLPGTAFGSRQPGGNGEASMKFYRLYSGDDGQSHFEQLDSSQSSEFFNAARPTKGLLFRNDFAAHIVNWHRAPRRRWVITLSGTVDIGLGEGDALGLGDGEADGLTEGDTLGLGDGEADGLAEGDARGLGDGEADGLTEGEGVALGEGGFTWSVPVSSGW